MLQDMDDVEASFVFYVKVATVDQLEQSKIGVLTDIKTGIFMLTVQHDSIVIISFM